MTKKKSRPEDEQQFEMQRSKRGSKIRRVQRQKNAKQKNYKRKQSQKLIVYNNLRMEDRRAHQQKYKENLIAKKLQEQKRMFLTIKYDDDLNSELANIDEDSVERREQNSTIRHIKDLLEREEIVANKHHLCTSAENQFYKVQKLTQQLASMEKQRKQMPLLKQQQEQLIDKHENILIGGEVIKDGQNLFGKDEIESDNKSILQKISQLELIYY